MLLIRQQAHNDAAFALFVMYGRQSTACKDDPRDEAYSAAYGLQTCCKCFARLHVPRMLQIEGAS